MSQLQTKERRREKSWVKWLVLILLGLGLLLGGIYIYLLQPELIPGIVMTFNEPVTGLLIAIDEDYYSTSDNGNENGNENKIEKVRADLILWGRISPEEESLELIFLPRHTSVQIPEWGEDMIRFSYMAGGLPMTKGIVESIIGHEVDYYAVIDFDSFVDIVEVLEGVELPIHKTIVSEELELFLEEGVQMLTSTEALSFARYIEEEEAELDRIRRQQQLALGIYNRALETRSLTRLPQLVMTIIETVRNIETNIDRDAVVKSVNFLREMEEPYPTPGVLPGHQEEDLWIIDEEGINSVIKGVE